MKNPITIRFAKNHDSDRIYRFLCGTGNQVYDMDEFETNYQKCLGNIHHVYLVAADRANLAIGFIACHGQQVLRPGPISCEIHELFVEKESQKFGVYSMLLVSLEKILMDKAVSSLSVSVNPIKDELTEIFSVAGFRQTQLKLEKVFR